jgi:hypothetical protein
VKGQSNWEIARTPRNAFRGSVMVSIWQVELPIGLGGVIPYRPLTNSEWPYVYMAVRAGVQRSRSERERTQSIV